MEISEGPVRRVHPVRFARPALDDALQWPLLTAQSKPATAVDYREVEALIQQHRFAEAKTAVLDELKQHPSSVEGLNLLGIIQTNQHDFPGAIASLQKALQLNPQFDKDT